MRITFFTHRYPPSVGGAQLLIERIATELASRGHEVHVVTIDAELSASTPRTEVRAGVTIERVPPARRLQHLVRSARRAGRRVLRRPPAATSMAPWTAGPLGLRLALAFWRAARGSDVLVAVPAPFTTLAAPLLAGRAQRRCRTVALPLLHLYGVSPHPVTMWALRRSDATVACTEYERDFMVRSGVPASTTFVVPPGCDPDAFPDISPVEARASLDLPERPTVGYVGRMAAHKGIDTFVEAMQQVWMQAPGTNLLLAGNRVGWERFDELIDRISAQAGDRLIVRERFDEADKAQLFSACDVVAFPSREESFGMVTVEAWCARRPVVVGDIAAVRSLVREGSDGFLVSPGDSSGLAQALLDLLADPDLRARMGRSGRRRAEVEFDWTRVVHDWDVLVRSVDDRSRRSPETVRLSGSAAMFPGSDSASL